MNNQPPTDRPIEALRSALAAVDPATLTAEDRAALLNLFDRALASRAGATGLTFGEAARRLGVDVQTVRRWARTEQCPVIREGRAVRVPAAWVAAQQ